MEVQHDMVPPSKCPVCQHELDCATCVDEPSQNPRVGDVTICIRCGEFLVFGEGMILRLPTREEYQEYGNDKRIIAAQIVVRGAAGKPDHLK